MPTREVLASFWRDWDRLGMEEIRELREVLGLWKDVGADLLR
jgi:hypothetical protein